MALVSNRSGVGGRKPVELANPFIVIDSWGDEENLLWNTEYRLDIRIEDILVGCSRTVSADSLTRKESVDWQKVVRIYRMVRILSTDTIQKYLHCSESQAHRYMKVIKLANPFVQRLLQGKSGTEVTGYVNFSTSQVKAGFLDILMEHKPKERVKKKPKLSLGETICTIIKQ